MSKNKNTGATPAFRGYRTQTLYILEKILNSDSRDVFYPEGAEDLLIKTNTGQIKDVVQIKNYSSNLALSDLEPEKEDSFLKRSLVKFYEEGQNPNLILVSYGGLGKELNILKTQKESSSIRKKLIAKNYSEDEIRWLFKYLSIEKVDETKLTELSIEHLSKSISGFSSKVAFDLLMFWLYKISENKGFIDREKLVSKLNSIGLFFSKRKSFLIEFGTTIQPFERENKINRELLAEEFYQGVSTRYEHIIEGFDVVREEKIAELKELFQNSNVVIIQGASGQGKSTLAYRYLHSYFPENHSFKIQQSFSTSQIPKIQAALKILVESYDLPISILIDVPPNEVEKWTQLIKALIEVENLKLLVTIRAEDYNRSESIGEFTKVGDLLLGFSKTEAQGIYEALSKIKSDFKFTSFEEAWINFGEYGSLLEFVYLITQGESLEIRLKNQLKRIENRWEENQIYLLKVIAVAHGYECEINVSNIKLISTSPKSKSFIEELENEYFLRTSLDKKLLLGLHPIRSQIISKLLIDTSFDDIEQIACDGLKLILEKDISKLLLNFFHDSNDSSKLLKVLAAHKITRWETAGDILRALFWLGIKKFSDINNNIITEFKNEYHTTIFLMIDDMGMGFDWSVFKEVNEERFEKMQGLIGKLSSKDIVYQFGKNWLTGFQTPQSTDMSDKDWDGLAYILYWMSRFEIGKKITFPKLRSSNLLKEIPIDVHANALLGLHSYSEESKKLYDQYLPDFIERVKEEYKLVFLNEENGTINTNFIYELENDNEKAPQKSVHQISINVVRLLRKAIPNKEIYATQGFGHKMSLIPYPYDDSIKKMPIRNLPVSWRTEINGIFLQFIEYQSRPTDWKDYTNTVIEVRKRSLKLLTTLTYLLEEYIKKKNFKLLEPFFTDYRSDWYNVELSKPNQLPKIALDKWGYSKERGKKDIERSPNDSINFVSRSKVQFLMGFGEYLETTRDFFRPLSTFFSQIDRVYIYNLFTINKKGEELKNAKLYLQGKGYNENILRLSIVNLFEAFQKLSKFQIQFDKHFSKFYSKDSLESLNNDENNCYLKASIIWKKFAQISKSIKSKKRTKKVLVPSALDIKSEIESKLDANLSFLCDTKKIETYDIVKFNENDSERIAVLFDVNTPLEVYLKFPFVLEAINKSFHPANYTSIKRLIIDNYFSPIVVVPLVYNRVVMPLYYQIPSYKFLDTDEELTLDSVGIYFKKFSNELLSKLKVDLWESEIPNLKNAQTLLGNNTSIALYLNHLAQIEELIQKLEDDNEKGIEMIIEHSKKKLKVIADLLIQNLDECSIITSDVSLTSEEMSVDDDRKEFAEIYMDYSQTLLDFAKLFNLDKTGLEEDTTVTATITSKDIVKWKSIFQEEMQSSALIIYLYWAGELIKSHNK